MDVETTVKRKFLEGSNMTFQEDFDFAFKDLIPVLQGLAKELEEDHFLVLQPHIARSVILSDRRERRIPHSLDKT
jgi:hypothetical protein